MSSSRAAKVWKRTQVGGGIALVLAGLLWLAARPGGERLVLGVGALLAVGAVYELVRMKALGSLLGAVTAVLAIVALPGLARIRTEYGAGGLVALLVLCKVGDIVGYYVGNAIGRSHPFPKISPGKTTAGCVGSLVAGTLAGALLQVGGVLPQASQGWLAGLLAGATINVAAQAGDLFESAVKRRSGVKDSGTWFGPSGGVLDLVDSLLFAVPLALLTWPHLFVGLTGS